MPFPTALKSLFFSPKTYIYAMALSFWEIFTRGAKKGGCLGGILPDFY